MIAFLLWELPPEKSEVQLCVLQGSQRSTRQEGTRSEGLWISFSSKLSACKSTVL